MGAASKVISVILRLCQLSSSVVVTALVGRFFYFLHQAHAHANSRLIYAQVVSALGILFSLLLIVPARYSFYAFPLDIVMFIMFIVAFALLANLNDGCHSAWYYSYWGFYWGRWWRRPIVTTGAPAHTSAGCGTWRTILAFLFIGAISWMLSAIIGAIISTELRKDHDDGGESHRTTGGFREKVLHRKHDPRDSVSTNPESQGPEHRVPESQV